MKIKNIILLVILVLLSHSNINLIYYANSNSSQQFGRINKSNVRLYKSAEENNNISNVICYLEPTYFVEILLNFNNDFYKVNYNSIQGYVLKKDITIVNGKPKNPYPKSELISINSKCYLRKTPEIDSKNSNTILIIPPNCKDLKFIGKMQGYEAIDYNGNIWFLVEYLGEYGYIYNSYISNISLIHKNTENLEPLKLKNEILNPLSKPTCIFIIVIILLPTTIILTLLYKKPKNYMKSYKTNYNLKKETKKSKNKNFFDNENL